MRHQTRQPMEGDSVHRPWLVFVKSLPFPFREIGIEIIRTSDWLEQHLVSALIGLRKSPTWFFVACAGLLCLGLTVMLFVSSIEQSAGRTPEVRAIAHRSATIGRDQLEQAHEWSAEDHWRIAHLFVPHKPVNRHKDIQLDSRLRAADDQRSTRDRIADRRLVERDYDIRLDLSRPKTAQQDQRLVSSQIDSPGRRSAGRQPGRLQRRQPQLLVQGAWQFSTDCNQYAYAGLPFRRLIPESLPIEEPPAPRHPARQAAPDLSFEMELIRSMTVAGQFPPGSRLITRSQRSEFPAELLSESSIGFPSYGNSHWQLMDRSRPRPHHDVIPYAGIGQYDSRQERSVESDDLLVALPAQAEVDLRIELVAPRRVAGGQVSRSQLIISNEGRQILSGIEVTDLVSQLQTVVAARPEALLEQVSAAERGGEPVSLHRQIETLLPGEAQELDVTWIPQDSPRQIHRALVIVQAAVSKTTTVIGRPVAVQSPPEVQLPPEKLPESQPSLACDLQYNQKAFVGDAVQLELVVRNTGNTDLHDVQVRIELPSQLSHKDGRNVVFAAGNLSVGGQSQTVVTVSAVEPGEAVNELQIAASEPIAARGKAHIQVVPRRKEATPAVEPAKPQPASPPPIVLPAQPMNGCWCPQVSMIQN